VSRHLAILKRAGIVQHEKRGDQIFYRLAAPRILEFFECLESVIRSRAETHLELSR